jgi:manganese/zinc/iron transport system permease protein
VIYYNTLVVLIGTSLLGIAAGLVGTFAVLRRRSLVGDAVAHAALPGLCLAFLIAGKSVPNLLLGALATGLLCVVAIAAVARWTRIKEDAAIGIGLTVFFGAGVALLSYIQKHPNDDPAGLNSYLWGTTGSMLAEDAALILGLTLLTLVVTLLLYKEFRLTAFDPEFARGQGWPTLLLDLALLGLIVIVVVIGLRSVGVLLVSAVLIVPAAAARFWTDRLSVMMIVSAGIGLLMGAGGTQFSVLSGLATGPVIVLTGTLLLAISTLLAPRHGVIARLVAHYRFRRSLRIGSP